MDEEQFEKLLVALQKPATVKQKAVEHIVMVVSGGVVTVTAFLCWHLFSTNDRLTHANSEEIRAVKEVMIDSFSSIDTERKMLTDRLARDDQALRDLRAEIEKLKERPQATTFWAPPVPASPVTNGPVLPRTQVNMPAPPPPDPAATLQSLEATKGKYQWKLDQAKNK